MYIEIFHLHLICCPTVLRLSCVDIRHILYIMLKNTAYKLYIHMLFVCNTNVRRLCMFLNVLAEKCWNGRSNILNFTFALETTRSE